LKTQSAAANNSQRKFSTETVLFVEQLQNIIATKQTVATTSRKTTQQQGSSVIAVVVSSSSTTNTPASFNDIDTSAATP